MPCFFFFFLFLCFIYVYLSTFFMDVLLDNEIWMISYVCLATPFVLFEVESVVD